MKKPHLRVCVICYNKALYDVSPAKKSIDDLGEQEGFTYEAVLQTGPCIADNRNYVVNGRAGYERHQKIKGGYTHVLSVDSDISFEAWHINQLLSHKKRIVSGVYLRRSELPGFEAWKFDLNGVNSGNIPSTAKGLMLLKGGAGFGFILIETNVYEEMEYPWFAEPIIKVNENQSIKQAEDAYFATQAMKLGIEYWLDCDCQVKHYHINFKEGDTTMSEVKEGAVQVTGNQQQKFNPNVDATQLLGATIKNVNKIADLVETVTMEVMLRDKQLEEVKRLLDESTNRVKELTEKLTASENKVTGLEDEIRSLVAKKKSEVTYGCD